MKKLILAAVLLSGMTFVACSSDDDNGGNNNADGCVTCEAYDLGMGITMEEQEVCRGDNGNAIVDGTDTGFPYNSYIDSQETVTDCN